MRLGIDLDGVVADFNGGWITRYNAEFGTDIPMDAVQSWGGMVGLTHFAGMSEFWRWAKGDGSGSLFRHLETYPDAVPALRKLARSGHEIVIITTKPQFAIHDTYAWLAEHRIPTREVHITSHKWRVVCDVYLEDAPHNLRRLHAERPEAAVVRFVRPWNAPLDGVRDVTDWQGFLELVFELTSANSE